MSYLDRHELANGEAEPLDADGLEAATPQGEAVPVSAATAAKKSGPGRNDPCPCGSGKRFKQCHGKLA